MKKYLITLSLLLIPFISYSQKTFKGMIMDKNNPKDNLGVFGANVYWLGTTVGTTTNEKGWFSIPYKSTYKKTGYKLCRL